MKLWESPTQTTWLTRKLVVGIGGRGGLEVKSLIPLNQFLPSKWIWYFATEKQVLSRKVISEKYGIDQSGGGRRVSLGKSIKWSGEHLELLSLQSGQWDGMMLGMRYQSMLQLITPSIRY